MDAGDTDDLGSTLFTDLHLLPRLEARLFTRARQVKKWLAMAVI
jgi:hypothetical protein